MPGIFYINKDCGNKHLHYIKINISEDYSQKGIT